ncbi:MAG: PDR/VanB family oxidoreductase [Pseudonocardiaceae bacterium]
MDTEPVPADLRDRPHPDRMWRIVGSVITTYSILTRRTLRRRRIVPVDRELPLLVDDVRVEAQNVRSYRLVARDGAQLPRWQPGSHLDVVLPSGRRRQYSLCGDPSARDYYRIAARRISDGGGGSLELHDTVEPGATLTVRGPRNGFPYLPAQQYLFIAGGIGITPILPMVTHAAATGARWQLIYTGRSRESMPFLDELATLDPERVLIRPDTEYGIPASGAELLAHAPAGAIVYCCAPAPMITKVRTDLPASGAAALHVERFTPPPIVNGKPFEVELQRSGRVLTVPAGKSALEVIREVAPQVSYSCRQGFCGTCQTRVISGAIDHRDQVLTGPGEPDTMTICVSRSTGGRIVLDL